MRLNELVALEQWNGRVPWTPGHELMLRSSGGAHIRHDRRITVVRDDYRSYVTGNRNAEIAGESRLATDFNMGVRVNQREELTVSGDAEVKALERMTIGVGHIRRNWTGAMTRLIGMEGVICGGGFAKFYVGGSVTMAPLVSGDVYGGGVHASAARIHMSGKMGYRSAERAMWAGGLLLRSSAITVEPLVDTRLQNKPANMAAKAARIGLGVCPVADILIGLATAPFLIAFSIYSIVKNWKKPPAPPKGPPRVHTRTAGVVMQTRASDQSA